jgi:hypothetical protein
MYNISFVRFCPEVKMRFRVRVESSPDLEGRSC